MMSMRQSKQLGQTAMVADNFPYLFIHRWDIHCVIPTDFVTAIQLGYQYSVPNGTRFLAQVSLSFVPWGQYTGRKCQLGILNPVRDDTTAI